jgi:tRNA/rRNA methyltransferase
MEAPAAMADLEGLIGQLEGSLEDAGYFYPPDRVQATKTTLRTILTKPQWSNREIQALRGVIRALSDHRSSKN